MRPPFHGLLDWYDRLGRRLPWREPERAADAYTVWVSEVMLQQTRVAAVIPYYERWLRRFPDLEALARARRPAVLSHWSGLGYYRRAAQMHEAARLARKRHDGRLPLDQAALLALPGIGPYTAAAILSIAAGQPLAAVDGNALRILSRLDGRHLRPAEAAARAAAGLDARRPGDFNQALMDLGATVCLPRSPRCSECPLSHGCATRGELRPARARPRPVAVKERYALYRDGRGRVWMRRRPADAARMPGLWELPAAGAEPWPALGSLRHAITFHAITAAVLAAPASAKPPGPGRWVMPGAAARLPLTGLSRKILRRFAGWEV